MAALQDLIEQITDPILRERIQQEVDKLTKNKKFGLVFEEHIPEVTALYGLPIQSGCLVMPKNDKTDKTIYTVIDISGDNAVCVDRDGTNTPVIFPISDIVRVAQFGQPIYPYLEQVDSICNAPDSDLWHTLIEADNYHALQLLEYLYAGKVDCIYIDPPYNKENAKDWKYNCNYVDSNDQYKHSKWLSMLEKRLKLAKNLLNPNDSVLIITIDETEYLHLGCLLEEMFPNANIQMISDVTNAKGVARGSEFFRVNEYLFIVRLGSCEVCSLPLPKEWKGNIKTSTTEKVRWGSLMRSGTNSTRSHSRGCFYPIFLSEDKKHICGAGDPLPLDVDRRSISVPEGQIAIFPIHEDGTEGCWQYSKDKFLEIQKKGYVRISTKTKVGVTIRYISEGWQKKVEDGQIKTTGHNEDGSLIFDDDEYVQEYIPCNQWWISSHNATEFGSKLIQNIIGKRFTYPKSLYAEHDAIRFFVANKPNALIVDFFAGSGTTLHAVNLLNAEDGGHRQCIIVTNNEVSESEEKALTKQGYHQGDPEWERYGIARYVTWPRTVCSIKGCDVNGELLKGKYISDKDIDMSDGFKTNVVYFKLGFLDKDRVALGRQFRELLPVFWIKAGARGPCPSVDGDELPQSLVLPENGFAVLLDHRAYSKFIDQVGTDDRIKTVYIVTDSESEYKSMIPDFEGKDTYQIYRDYLDNFRINTGDRT